MSLDTYHDPDELYLARANDVNPNRPLFTGDVYRNIAIPGVQDTGMGIIVAHPCGFRGSQGRLADRILMAKVNETTKQGANAWTQGMYDRMPLPDVAGDGYWAAWLSEIGRASTTDVQAAERIACLSQRGLNVLQQRLTHHLTRVEVPTETFQQAFAHTFDEADLLEEWTDTLTEAGWSQSDAASSFESFIRDGKPSLQDRLLQPQDRAFVRRACHAEARRLSAEQR